MNKKILVGVSAIFVAAGFWACGNGDIITKGEDEKTAEIVDEEMINQLKDKAIKDCQESPECEAKMADADKIPEPESSGDGGDTPTPGGDDEGGNGGNGGTGGGPVPTTSTSRPTPSSNPSTGSSGSSDQPPTSSPSTVTDASVPDGTCTGSAATITKEGSVTWTFTAKTLDMSSISGSITEKLEAQNKYNELVASSTCEWTIEGAGKDGKALTTSGACGSDGKTVTATYAKIGNYKTSIKLGENTIDCGTVAVEGPAVTGCKCAVDPVKPDVKNGDVTVTWTVSGCKAGTDSPNEDWKWAWTGPTGSTTSATATVSAKGDTKTASVKVTSAENASMNVTCPQVKAINSNIPDYLLTEKMNDQNTYLKDTKCVETYEGYCVKVPNGQTVVLSGNAASASSIRCIHPWQQESCYVTLTSGSESMSYKDQNTKKEEISNCGIYWPDPFAVSSLTDHAFTVEITNATEVYCFVQ